MTERSITFERTRARLDRAADLRQAAIVESVAPVPPTHPDDLEAIVKRVSDQKAAWATTPLTKKIELLRGVLAGLRVVAERWVEAAALAKGLGPGDPRSGEEWLSGPMPVVQNVRILIDSLSALASGAEPAVGRVRTVGERAVVRVFPLDVKHRVVLAGITADVWVEPGKPPTRGTRAKSPPEAGRLTAVLGAGNISAIPAMDVLYKMFAEGDVVVLKMNPLNEAIGPLMESAFRGLIDAGVFAVVYGGADVGARLTEHPLVDALHVTGSDATYEAIVFGGENAEERAARKARGEVANARPFTAELGCVTPVIVAPGPYSRAHLAYQAEHVAAMLTHNGGFNCDAAQVLVVARDWLQKKTFFELLREELRKIPPRATWVPGAADRHAAIVRDFASAEPLGTPVAGTLPWTLVTGLDPSGKGGADAFFRHEAFCGALGVVELDVAAPDAFLAEATRFANERLWGTLSAVLVVHPTTADEHEAALDRAIAELRYGVVAVNVWPGVAFTLAAATWGAYPGHPATDIQSGAGVVHNALLFDHPEKTVLRGPFKSSPPPPYFPRLAGLADLGRALLALEAAPSWGGVIAVARAGLAVKAPKHVAFENVREVQP